MTNASSNPILHALRRAVEDHRTEGLSDDDLLLRFRSDRDESCFHALLRRHGPMVLAVCRAVLRNEADAEDAFQATFLVLVRKADSVRAAGSVCSWLHGVAHRTALRARVDSARRRKHEERALPQEACSPEGLIGWDGQLVLHEELNRLGEGYRTPLVLCYLEGQTQDEAARRLGLPKGTLKGRLERGRALLRKRLARRGLAPEATFASVACAAPLSASAAARAASVVAGGDMGGIVSDRVRGLAEGVVRAMFVSKIKVVAAVAVCLTAFAVAVLAAGQGGGPRRDSAPAQGEPVGPGDRGKVQQRGLSPEALAAHLGVIHKSFELSFDKAPAGLTLSVDVYEEGKRIIQGREVASLENAKKHACAVLFSRAKVEGKLDVTVITPLLTFHDQIDDPFGGPPMSYPGPRMDAKGRIPLALKPAKTEGGAVEELTVENAARALVVQVRKKK
jgi:RNA polymerase sigma factor (sigma-70 family)